MRMDRRFRIVLAASLLWGLLVAGFFHRVAAGTGAGARSAAEKPLVVASQALPLGATVSRDSVRLRMVPENLFPAGGASRIEDVLERPVISPIQGEEAVVEARLAARGSGPGLAPLIPPGMRAISVRVNDVVGVAGFVLPGMRVDVLVTGSPPGRAETFTRTVLQNITVLSAGQTIETDGKNAAMNVPVVTLLVNPAQAEALTLANIEARIQLVLRNSNDRQVAGTHGSQTQELFGGRPETAPEPAPAPKLRRPAGMAAAVPAAPAPAQPAQPTPPPPSEQVMMIRGNVKTLEPVPESGGGKTARPVIGVLPLRFTTPGPAPAPPIRLAADITRGPAGDANFPDGLPGAGTGAASMALLILADPAAALDSGRAPVPISLVVGRGTVIDCPYGVTRVATSNPEAVDAVAASDREVLFHGKALGQATLVVWSKDGERRTYEVTVEPNLEPLRELLKGTFPGENIDVRETRDSLALVGRVSTQGVADRALALVAPSMKGAVSNLQIAPPPPERQILLRVRFAELNRSAATEFGMNLLSTGAARTIGGITTGQFPSGSLAELSGGVPASGASSTKFSISDLLNVFAFRTDLNLGLLIQDLESRGLLQILAEPNLVATNGKEATFLAGGEFPVPIVQGGASAGGITVQFREFGIRLSFLPQITANRTMRMHVKPEVSTIDPADGVTISGFHIPALSTRRIETDVELTEGQSFAIAGLLDERVTQNLSRMPGLASVPLLGALFRSRSQNKSKDELVVVVTPETVAPETGGTPLPAMPVPFLGPAAEEGKKPK